MRGNSPCEEVHADQNPLKFMYQSCAHDILEDLETDMAAAAQAPTSYSPSPMYTPSPTPKPTPQATQQQQQPNKNQNNNNQNNNMNTNNNNSESSPSLFSFSAAPYAASRAAWYVVNTSLQAAAESFYWLEVSWIALHASKCKMSAYSCAEVYSDHFCTGCCSLTFCGLCSALSPGLQRGML